MGNYENLHKLKKQARIRVRKLKFAEPVTNICTGEKSPHHHAYFVKNNACNTVKCTNKKGKFWDTMNLVIHSGHLDSDACEKLWNPVWEAEYGSDEVLAEH